MAETPAQEAGVAEAGDDGEFVRVRFAGGRFDSHTIPFDVLPDLAAYRDLIVDVAKHLYRQRHPDRQRVPKGFVESFQLGLSRVIQGNSATALARRIEVVDEAADQAEFGFPRYIEFEDARNLVDRVIAAANDDHALPHEFPRDLVSRFNRFGQNLQDAEHAEISHSNAAPVRYDSRTRKRIVLSANATIENQLDQRFLLTGGELPVNLVHLMDEDGNRFHLHVNSDEDCEKAIARRRHHVRVVGTGLFDRHDRLTKITGFKELIFNDDEPRQSFEDRLDDIARTPSGWYSPGNPSPNAAAIEKMRVFIQAITSEGVPGPYIYPLPDGGITAEWTRGDWEISATVEADSSNVDLHALNVESDDELEEAIVADAEILLGAFNRFWNAMDAERGDA